jgi:hypothetical protein
MSRRQFLQVGGAAAVVVAGGLAAPTLMQWLGFGNKESGPLSPEQKMRVFTVGELLKMQTPENLPIAQDILAKVGTKYYGEGMQFDPGDTVIEMPIPEKGKNEAFLLGFAGLASGAAGKGKGSPEGLQIKIQRREDTDQSAIEVDPKNNNVNASILVYRTAGIAGNFQPLAHPLEESSLPGYDQWLPMQMLDKSIKPGMVTLGSTDSVVYFLSPQKSVLDKNNVALNVGGRANISKAELSFPSKP